MIVKNIISIFFTVIFLAFLTAPAVIVMVDNSVDVSCFYSVSEEEKENGTNVFFHINLSQQTNFSLAKSINNDEYYFKKYSTPHLNIISPPPELI